ncbi:tetraspanin-8-like [Phoenix dactylifera]|uniref:Tetraspanin-8-like n=1 Tax=Phoenix dactylifera TaxID=42345 RepID=A0A8B8ZHN5_PHODC|nr:tetraspanin-8-like [Phoenix dactylifera]XP_038973676.1 tetraspanin-8-like [Phoenix dactylifera]
MAVGHCFLGVLNFVAFLLSLSILVGGIGLSDCNNFVQHPVIAVAAILMAACLAATAAACFRAPRLFWLSFLSMLVLVLVLCGLVVFGFVLTGDDYSQWRQERLAGDKNWAETLSCVRRSPECRILQEEDPQSLDDFNDLSITHIQSGCCLPPTECGFVFQSVTVWTNPTNTTLNNTDCSTWKNDPSILCYDCQSCKAETVASIKYDWKEAARNTTIFLVYLIVIFSFGCYTLHQSAHPGWKGYS